jgi:hypothetical protein
VAVAAGCYHSLAVRSDGTVWAWGYNSSGQLGDGTTSHRTALVLTQWPSLKTSFTVEAWFMGHSGDGAWTGTLTIKNGGTAAPVGPLTVKGQAVSFDPASVTCLEGALVTQVTTKQAGRVDSTTWETWVPFWTYVYPPVKCPQPGNTAAPPPDTTVNVTLEYLDGNGVTSMAARFSCLLKSNRTLTSCTQL